MTAVFSRLAAALDGTLALPGAPSHDAARLPLVRDAEHVPAAVVRCASARDVATAVRFASDAGLPFAVRGGGHSFADRSSTTGLLVDLGALDHVEVRDTVTVGPGVRVAALDRALAARDLVVPVGWCPGVGVVGAALGGGFGPFGRLHGLACDHIVAAEVVLADGRIVRADEDLLWALRGAGGGQFGVVTSLELRTHQASRAVAFDLTWTAEHAEQVLTAWQDWAPAAPDSLNAELVLAAGRNPDTAALAVVFGVSVHGEPDLAPLLRRVGVAPLRDRRSVRAPTDHSYAGAPVDPRPPGPPPPGTPAGRRVVRSEYFDRPLPPEAIGALVDHFRSARVPGQYREIEFVPWRGAYARPADAAFAHRTPSFLVEHNADATTGDHVATWVGRSWSLLHPWGTGAVYPNYPDPDLTDWARAYHGAGLDRLVEVKRAYDPRDLFTSAQSLAGLAGQTTAHDGQCAPHQRGTESLAPTGGERGERRTR